MIISASEDIIVNIIPNRLEYVNGLLEKLPANLSGRKYCRDIYKLNK